MNVLSDACADPIEPGGAFMIDLANTDLLHASGLAGPLPAFDDTIAGTSGDDALSGTDLNDRINGKAGDDVLNGLGGDDSLLGGSGDDTLVGGSGDDTLDGGSGTNSLSAGSGDDLVFVTGLPDQQGLRDDRLDGGSGMDTLSFAHSHHGVDFDLRNAGGENIVNFENLIGSAFDDFLDGSQNVSQVIDGGAGNDWLVGSDERQGMSDTLIGGDGNDRLFSANHADLLQGGDGDDHIHGQAGADTIDGGAGEDRIRLNLFGSVVTGGAGPDQFEFSAPHLHPIGETLITDLENQDDVIDLARIDADTGTAGDQAFTLVANLDGHVGQAALAYDAGSDQTSLLLDTDGGGTADITILLSGDHTDFTNFAL